MPLKVGVRSGNCQKKANKGKWHGKYGVRESN